MNNDLPALDAVDIGGDGEYPPDASVRLHGPPGTGKTTTEAARVGRLLRDYGYDIGDIVWGTYRKSLAADTLRRLAEWGVIDFEQLNKPTEGDTQHIGTFHANGRRAVGGVGNPVELWQKQQFCDDLGLQYSGGPPWVKQPGELLFQVFDWLNNNLLDPADPADIARADPPGLAELRSQWNGSIPDVWAQWEDYKQVMEIADFHEMLRAPIEDSIPCPGDVLVIDEYHDAYPLMAKFCEQWMADAEVVIVAGDPHQVVNTFDGADPLFFNRLPFPKVLLDTTYRVPEEHWQVCAPILANAARHEPPPVERISHGEVSHHNEHVGRFDYHAQRAPTNADIGHWNVPDSNTENGPAALALRNGSGAEDPDGPGIGRDPGSVMFLARTRQQADGIGAALERAGILYTGQRDMRGWNADKKHIRVRLRLFSALTKLYRFNVRALASRVSLRGAPTNTFDAFDSESGHAVTDTLSLTAVETATLIESMPLEDLDCSTTDDRDDLANALRYGRQASVTADELREWVTDDFWTNYVGGATVVDRLLKSTLTDRDRTTLRQALRRHAGTGPLDTEDIGVQVLTIHASKGQEADDVVVYDGITKRIAESMRLDADERANEWRTWYVATSRAHKRLHIVHGGFDYMTPLPNNALAPGGE